MRFAVDDRIRADHTAPSKGGYTHGEKTICNLNIFRLLLDVLLYFTISFLSSQAISGNCVLRAETFCGKIKLCEVEA